jgi:hypothetical protein
VHTIQTYPWVYPIAYQIAIVLLSYHIVFSEVLCHLTDVIELNVVKFIFLKVVLNKALTFNRSLKRTDLTHAILSKISLQCVLAFIVGEVI